MQHQVSVLGSNYLLLCIFFFFTLQYNFKGKKTLLANPMCAKSMVARGLEVTQLQSK